MTGGKYVLPLFVRGDGGGNDEKTVEPEGLPEARGGGDVTLMRGRKGPAENTEFHLGRRIRSGAFSFFFVAEGR